MNKKFKRKNNPKSKLPNGYVIGVLRLVRFFKVQKCNHHFKCLDIYRTNIPLKDPPKTRGYKEWGDYLVESYKEDGHVKRVACKCRKCGGLFYAHCGLSLPGKLI